MKPHTDVPGLADLTDLVAKERRTVAAELRIKREQHELRERMEQLLETSGVEAVLVSNHLGTFEVRRAVTRTGERYATVTKVKGDGDA